MKGRVPRPRVLVLDAEARSALAVTRSLGAAGYEVAVCSPDHRALAANSRHCCISFIVPDPRTRGDEYRREIIHLTRAWKPKFLFPLTDLSLERIAPVRDALSELTCIPLPRADILDKVRDKHSLLELARGLGLNVPESLAIPSFNERTQEDVQRIKRFVFPAVLKPRSAESSLGESFVRTPVYYPVNADEALSLVSVSTMGAEAKIPFLLQQRIFGDGVGVFALLRRGEVLATFCHRRLLEKPPSGGPSVLSESIPETEAPVEDALKLLHALEWDGIAMVEFKRDSSGRAFLMEINPRFWGSLQLAIDSGRDFPRLLCEAFSTGPWDTSRAGEYRRTLPAYTVGTRLRWFFGSLDHFLIRLKEAPIRALADFVLRNSLQIFAKPKNTRLEILRRDDPWPFAYEVRSYFAQIFRRSAA